MVPGHLAGSGKAAAGYRSPRPSAGCLGVSVTLSDGIRNVAIGVLRCGSGKAGKVLLGWLVRRQGRDGLATVA